MDYYALDFGAAGDGKNDDREFIQNAIDKAHGDGGGRVIINGCRVYLSSSLVLKSGVELHVERGSKLLATPVLEDYINPNKGVKTDKYAGQNLFINKRFYFCGKRNKSAHRS